MLYKVEQKNNKELKMKFNELIPAQEFQRFNKEILFKQTWSAPLIANQYKKWVNWDLLQTIFASGHDDCWVAKNGLLPKDNHLTKGILTINLAAQAFTEGYTIVIRHSEKVDLKLAALAQDFYDHFKKPVDIQLYATPIGQQGFNWHYDLEDVFVIQSSGIKEFQLRKNKCFKKTIFDPKDLIHFKQLSEEAEVRCLLYPGDLLYIPAGHWHKAKAVTDSFHLSIGVLF